MVAELVARFSAPRGTCDICGGRYVLRGHRGRPLCLTDVWLRQWTDRGWVPLPLRRPFPLQSGWPSTHRLEVQSPHIVAPVKATRILLASPWDGMDAETALQIAAKYAEIMGPTREAGAAMARLLGLSLSSLMALGAESGYEVRFMSTATLADLDAAYAEQGVPEDERQAFHETGLTPWRAGRWWQQGSLLLRPPAGRKS